jgi:PAS domain S-box-containing protein
MSPSLVTFSAIAAKLPWRARALAGAAGAGLVAAAECCSLAGAGGAVWNFAPAAVLLAGLAGDWLGAMVCISISVTWMMLSKGWVVGPVLLVFVGSALCSELLRRRVRLPIAVAVLTTCFYAQQLNFQHVHGLLPPWTLVASWLVAAMLNVAMAVLFMLFVPRRSRWLAPRRRSSLEDHLFLTAACPMGVAAVTLPALTAHLAPTFVLFAVVANLTVLLIGDGLTRTSDSLYARLRSPPHAARRGGARLRYGRLTAEFARPFLGGLRQTDRLQSKALVQGLQLESARRQAVRLRQSRDSSQQAVREKDLEIHRATESRNALDKSWRAFLDAVPESVLLTDEQGRIEFANEAIRTLLGYRPEALSGVAISKLLEDGQRWRDALELDRAAGPRSFPGSPRESDWKFHDATGKTCVLAVRVQAFQFQGRRCFALRLRDVKGLRLLVQELKRARQGRGSEKRSPDQFIATMSHEIRTPLHGLMATLDMLRSESLTQEGRHRLAIARASAKALISIANDILDLSRVNADVIPLDRKPFSLDRMLTGVVDNARARADSLGLELSFRTGGTLPSCVTGDSRRITQILTNLLANALKFTSTGSIVVHARYADGRCIVDVADTGEGVPEEMRQSIFEPFVQADSARSRRFGGSGLGLAISRRLSEAMGGSLVLSTTGPRGSTFTLTLPLEVSDEEPAEEQSQRILQTVHGRILVVEDDEVSRYVAQSLLESLECPAAVVASGALALELLQREEFDLVLIDCEMPELDGYETARRARTLLERRIPIVAMTASTTGEDRQQCFDAGMNDILAKPFGKSALNDMLCKWLAPQPSPANAQTLQSKMEALPVIDVGVFDELRATLRWQVGPLRKVYGPFLQAAREAASLVSGTAGESWDAVARRLHSLQGSAGLVGARQVEHLVAWMNHAIRQQRPQDVAETALLLREAVLRVERDLESRLEDASRR